MGEFIKLTDKESGDELILRTDLILCIETIRGCGSRITYRNADIIYVFESVSEIFKHIEYAQRLSRTTYINEK